MKSWNKSRRTEQQIVDAAEAFLRGQGYRVLPQVRIRTWRPDLVGLRGDELVIVEAKASAADLRKALAQTAVYATDATSAYLALPRNRMGEDVKRIARVLGIGLLGVDDAARVIVAPSRSEPRPTLVRRIRRTAARPSRSVAPTGRLQSPPLGGLLKHRRVLEALLARPGRRFTVRELSQEAKTPYSTTWRLVRSLDALGVVTTERFGSSTVLSLNEASPVLPGLRRLPSLELAPHRLAARDFAERLAEVPDVRRAVLFGSVARGTETASSDVDVAVVVERKGTAVLDRVRDLAEAVQDRTRMKIAPMFVTETELRSNGRIARTLRSGEVLYERS